MLTTKLKSLLELVLGVLCPIVEYYQSRDTIESIVASLMTYAK